MAAVAGIERAGRAAPAPTRRAVKRRSYPVWRWVILLAAGIYFLIPLYAALRFAGISSFGQVFHQAGFSTLLEPGRGHHGAHPGADGADNDLRSPAPAGAAAPVREHHDPAHRHPARRADPRGPAGVAGESQGDALPARAGVRGLGHAVRLPLAGRRTARARPQDAGRCVQLARRQVADHAVAGWTLVDASNSLGAKWPTTLWRVVLPNL